MSPRIIWPLAAALLVSACNSDTPETELDAPLPASSTTDVPKAQSFSDDSAWRMVDPDNLLIIDTKYGDIGIELYPEIAPKHVEQIKKLTREGFYNNVVFHRVLDGFMNQTGDGSNGNGTGDSKLPNIEAEFTFRRGADMPITQVTTQKVRERDISFGFYKGLPVASQPISMAAFSKDGTVNAFALHCKGITSMARTNDPNSANSQFFLMRAEAEHLNAQYSIWGNTVMGYDLLEKPAIGTVGEVPGWKPDRMNKVELASDIAEAERPKVQVMRTKHPEFDKWLKTQKKPDGSFPAICDLVIPTRVQ